MEKKMKLQKRTYKKFSIVLTAAVVFLALLAVAAAHGKLVFTDRFANIFSIGQDNSKKIVLSKTEFLNNSNADGDSDKGGAGISIQCYDPTFTGGISVAVGDLDSDSLSMNRIDVSRISLLTGSFDGGAGVVDSCDPDAASKIKMLFEVRSNLRLTNDVVIDIPQNNTAEGFETLNYLRGTHASGTRIPVLELFVIDSGSSKGMKITLKDVTVSIHGMDFENLMTGHQIRLNFREAQTPPISEIVVTKSNDG